MALISDATVIIEASDSSGSLSQGWEALRLGRALFITKALTENKEISWTREMLDHGARVLSDETLQDFLDILPERSETELDVALPF
jgi:DNA processing protein